MKRKRRYGFTLLELLVVIAILVVLAGLISSGAKIARRKAYVTKARAMIAALETSISMYESDRGFYPAADSLVTELTTQQIVRGVVYGPYIELDSGEVNVETVVDPWGNPYKYEISGPNNPYSFDLSSNGPDGTADSADDVTNW